MTPDFAEFLLQTPENERRGRVFRLNHARRGTPLAAMAVSKLVTKIGKEARIVVNSADGKTASRPMTCGGHSAPVGLSGSCPGRLAEADASCPNRHDNGLLR